MAVANTNIAQSLFGEGAAASRFQASNTNIAQIYDRDIQQEYMRRSIKRNFEEKLVFDKFFMEENYQQGYLSYSIRKGSKLATSTITNTTSSGLGNTSSTIGVTPSPTSIQFNTIRIQPQQFVQVHTFADMAARYNVFSWSMDALTLLMENMGRRVDEYLQNIIYTRVTGTGGTVQYTNSLTAVGDFTTTNKAASIFKMEHLILAKQTLEANSAPKFPMTDTYMCAVHPAVVNDIFKTVSATAVSWSTLAQHTPTMVGRVIRGYVGTVFGVSVVQSDNINTKTNGMSGNALVTLYPTFFIAYNSLSKIKYFFQTYTGGGNSTAFDPAAQLYWAAVKCEVGATVSENDGVLAVISSASNDI